jgi:hypothetical protein
MSRTAIDRARHDLEHGDKFPFDVSDRRWNSGKIPPPKDWAHRAARGIIADLQDRRGIKGGFDDIDLRTRIEIVKRLAAIIRLAEKEGH